MSLIYAIGDVVLLLAGVLIAFWINNKNQEEQITATSVNLQEILLRQLEEDEEGLAKIKN